MKHARPADGPPSIAVRAFARSVTVTAAKAVAGFHDAGEVVARSADGRPISLQVDGDFIGEGREARLSVAPGRLTVVS